MITCLSEYLVHRQVAHEALEAAVGVSVADSRGDGQEVASLRDLHAQFGLAAEAVEVCLCNLCTCIQIIEDEVVV